MLRSRPMLPLFLTVFFGFVGISLPFPIFSPLLLSSNSPLMDPATSESTRGIFLGLLLSIYPFGQFIGAPILGQMSDHWGRKRLLVISLSGTFLAHLATAYFLIFPSYIGIFCARFFCGLMESNVAIAQSAAADLGRGSIEAKTKNFSLINTASYLGFLLGPFLGGLFGDPKMGFPYFLPFILASLFCGATIAVVVLMFQDTTRKAIDQKRIQLLSSIRRLTNSWRNRDLRFFYLLNFLLFMSMYFFFQFYAPFTVVRFQFTPFWIAMVSAYLSLAMTLSQIFLVHRVTRWLGPAQATLYSAAGITVGLWLTLTVQHAVVMALTIPFCALFFATAMTNISVLISNAAGDEQQGEAMGITQSTQVLGEGFVCLVGGYAFGLFHYLPFFIGGCIALATFGMVFLMIRRGRRSY